MADNYIERQYDDYLRQKAANEQKRRIEWQRRLRAYRAQLQQSPDKKPK